MGDMASYQEEGELWEELVNSFKREADVWVTKGGERIAYRDLSDEHLINCIKLLRRKTPTSHFLEVYSLPWQYLRAEARRRNLDVFDVA